MIDNMDDKHTQLFAKHFRICANKLGRVAYSTVKHTTLLEQAFGVNGSVDQPEVHPASFCNRCYSTAQRVTKCAREGKHIETSCRPFEWNSHSDDCFFCMLRLRSMEEDQRLRCRSLEEAALLLTFSTPET